MKPTLFTLLAALAFTAPVFGQEQPGAAETKLRDSLKATMLQLRTAETEKATLQAAQSENEAKLKELTAELEAVKKKAAANGAEAEKAHAELTERLLSQEKETARISTSLDKWKVAYHQAADVARRKESERAKLASEKIVLERKVADRETKNLELYGLGKEILLRYENFSLGRALLAREPFTGVSKVRLEELIEGYRDKITDAKIKPEPAAAAATTTAGRP